MEGHIGVYLIFHGMGASSVQPPLTPLSFPFFFLFFSFVLFLCAPTVIMHRVNPFLLSFPPSSRPTTSFSVRFFYLLSRNCSMSWICLPVRICQQKTLLKTILVTINKMRGARKNGDCLEAIDNV